MIALKRYGKSSEDSSVNYITNIEKLIFMWHCLKRVF